MTQHGTRSLRSYGWFIYQPFDQQLSDHAAYMKRLKKYADVMNNLNWSIPIECKAVKFNQPEAVISSLRRFLAVYQRYAAALLASRFRLYETIKDICQNC
jgi:hypothetical protein